MTTNSLAAASAQPQLTETKKPRGFIDLLKHAVGTAFQEITHHDANRALGVALGQA